MTSMHTRDRDDAAEVLRDHAGRQQVHQVERGVEIDRPDGAPVLESAVVDGALSEHAGDGDEHVDAAHLASRRCSTARQSVRVGEIGDDHIPTVFEVEADHAISPVA